MYVIYHAELPFFERYKINSLPWPWQENPKEWKILVKKSVALLAFNSLVCVPSLLFIALSSNNWEPTYDMSVEGLPDWRTFMIQVLFCMIIEDFGFHFGHRFLHWRVIYPYFHKVHHTYVKTVGIAAEYSHPVDFFISALIPGALGSLILGKRMHYCSTLLWTLVRVSETLDGHCGYEFSWSPYRLMPFSTSAAYHDFHHSHNVGNYSSFFSFWDTLSGTNKAFYQYLSKMREA
jgi:sterol desaturase/sphingolipid hydroxylase (fatty acid hydroxylase superfamily)